MVRDPRDIFNSLKLVKWSYFFAYKLRIKSYKKMVKVDKMKNVYTVKYKLITKNYFFD